VNPARFRNVLKRLQKEPEVLLFLFRNLYLIQIQPKQIQRRIHWKKPESFCHHFWAGSLVPPPVPLLPAGPYISNTLKWFTWNYVDR
jgi:hypothetical protein